MEKELLVMKRKQFLTVINGMQSPSYAKLIFINAFFTRKIDSATHKWLTLPRRTDVRNLCHSYWIWYDLQITTLALDLQYKPQVYQRFSCFSLNNISRYIFYALMEFTPHQQWIFGTNFHFGTTTLIIEQYSFFLSRHWNWWTVYHL